MPADPLPIIHYSVVVKSEAVDRAYAGGAEDFERVLQPARSNDDLYVVARMSTEDAGDVFERLQEAGLRSGEDFGLYGMFNGALVACNGIRAIGDDRNPFAQQSVQADPTYQVPVEEAWIPERTEPTPPTPPVLAAPADVPLAATKTPWRNNAGRPGAGLIVWFGGDDDDD